MAVKKSKKLKELVLKVNPLEETKPKKAAKPAKVLVKKVKPKKSNLVKPRSENLTRFSERKPNIAKPRRTAKLSTGRSSRELRSSTGQVKFLLRGKSIKPLVYPVRGQRVLRKAQGKQTSNGVYKTRIKVLGIGGGGSSIVSEIASEVKKVTFVVADADFQILQEATKEAKHLQFGKSITQGLGTGMNPELGEQAAENDKEKIKELLKETDFCILISCLGGGTGSGASPVFANILKNLGIPALGIFTLPFEFEGGKRTQIAKNSLEKLRQNLNALVIIPNQKIFQTIDKNILLKEALSTINKALIENLEGLITLIYSSGLIQVGFADLKTILAGRGRLAYFNTVETPIHPALKLRAGATEQAKGPNQIEELAKKVVSSPLIPYTVQGAKGVLFNIDGGLNLNIEQVDQIGKTISSLINPRARVAFGITQNKKEGIKITLLANGCKWDEWGEKEEKPKKELKEKPKKKASPKIQPSEITQISTEEPGKVKIKVRKNALEVQKAVREEEKKILAREKKWESPAFLRRDFSQINEEKEN